MDTEDFLNDVDEEFLCTICHNMMVNPHRCNAGHHFCFDCITRRLQTSKTCPSDRGDLDEASLKKDRSFHNLINKLRVRCSKAAVNWAVDGFDGAGGCEWSGPLSERARHLRDECAFGEVECGLAGCDLKVRRAQLARHEAACEHREVACEQCKDRLTARESDQHQLTCRGVKIDCPQECGKKVARGELAEHEKECGEAVVCCSFAEYGCQARTKRRKISEHEEEATVRHLELAANTAERQREGSLRLEKVLAEKMKQVTEQKEHVLALEAELKDCETANEAQVLALEAELKDCHAANEKQVTEHQKQVLALLNLLKDGKTENQKQVLALQAQLKEGQTIGEVKVVWKIEDFTEKLKLKAAISSQTFHVYTKAGQNPIVSANEALSEARIQKAGIRWALCESL